MSEDSESEVNLNLGKGEPDSDQNSDNSDGDDQIIDGSDEDQEVISDSEEDKSPPKNNEKKNPPLKKTDPAPKKYGPKKNTSHKLVTTSTLPHKTIVSEGDQNGKTIFSKISENLFSKYLNTESASRPSTFEELTTESYLKTQQDKMKKDNKKKFKNMIERHAEYENKKRERMKERKDKFHEQLKSSCTWTPNGVKIENLNPDDFYQEQKKFVEEKKQNIQKMTKEQKKKEKVPKGQLISENSKKIVETTRKCETKEEFFKRLKNEKLKAKREKKLKRDDDDEEEEEPKMNVPEEKPPEKKKTLKEIQELTNKLYSESETLKRNKESLINQNLQQIYYVQQNTELVSSSTKKVLLDKFISNYEKALLELFNKKENIDMSNEEYLNLLTTIGCVNEKTDKELINESFNKYLNVKEDHINSDQFLVFALSFLGIYKGSDEPVMEKDEKKLPTSTQFIKNFLPELDFEAHQYTMRLVQIIKKKFLPFCGSLISHWSQENAKKRQEKQEKLSQSMTTSNNLSLRKSKKNQERIESSRKRMFEQASQDIDENEQAQSLSPNSRELQEKATKNQLKLEDVYQILQKRKEKERANLRAQKEQDEFKECTFQPNAATKPVNPKDVPANIEKLYTDGKITYMKKLRKEDRNPNETKELEMNCTFRPEIHKMNENIFSVNPIGKDQRYIDQINLMEEARLKRNVQNFQLKMGVTNIRLFQSNLDNGAYNDNLPSMRFYIEAKTNKDSFSNFEQKKRNFKKISKTLSDEKKEEGKDGIAPLLKVEVNIDDNNKIEKLEIYPGDDPVKITEDFCEKHGLGEDKKMRLQRIIQEKLNEATNENFSVSQQS